MNAGPVAVFLPGTRTRSAPMLGGGTVLLAATVPVACYIPARHARRISPTQGLLPR